MEQAERLVDGRADRHAGDHARLARLDNLDAERGEQRHRLAARNAHAITSKSPAAPMPPPMHIVTTTNFAPRRRPSISAGPVRRAPDPPDGWPTPTPPPLTLRRSPGMPSRSRQ